MSNYSTVKTAIEQKRSLALKTQPTVLRRCLKCWYWMHSTGPDHRICNPCKGVVHSCSRTKYGMPGMRVAA